MQMSFGSGSGRSRATARRRRRVRAERAGAAEPRLDPTPPAGARRGSVRSRRWTAQRPPRIVTERLVRPLSTSRADAPRVKEGIDSSLDHLREFMDWAWEAPQPLERGRGAAGRVPRRGSRRAGTGSTGFSRPTSRSTSAAPGSTRASVRERSRSATGSRASRVREGIATETAAALPGSASNGAGSSGSRSTSIPRTTPSLGVPAKLGYVAGGRVGDGAAAGKAGREAARCGDLLAARRGVRGFTLRGARRRSSRFGRTDRRPSRRARAARGGGSRRARALAREVAGCDHPRARRAGDRPPRSPRARYSRPRARRREARRPVRRAARTSISTPFARAFSTADLDRDLVHVDRDHRREAKPCGGDREHARAAADVEQAARLLAKQQLEAEAGRGMRAGAEGTAGIDDDGERSGRWSLPRGPHPERADRDRVVELAPALLPPLGHLVDRRVGKGREHTPRPPHRRRRARSRRPPSRSSNPSGASSRKRARSVSARAIGTLTAARIMGAAAPGSSITLLAGLAARRAVWALQSFFLSPVPRRRAAATAIAASQTRRLPACAGDPAAEQAGTTRRRQRCPSTTLRVEIRSFRVEALLGHPARPVESISAGNPGWENGAHSGVTRGTAGAPDSPTLRATAISSDNRPLSPCPDRLRVRNAGRALFLFDSDEQPVSMRRYSATGLRGCARASSRTIILEQKEFDMAKKTVRVSDMSGEEFPDWQGRGGSNHVRRCTPWISGARPDRRRGGEARGPADGAPGPQAEGSELAAASRRSPDRGVSARHARGAARDGVGPRLPRANPRRLLSSLISTHGADTRTGNALTRHGGESSARSSPSAASIPDPGGSCPRRPRGQAICLADRGNDARPTNG